MKEKLSKLVKNFIRILRKPEMQILPGELAFYFLMSFIPIIALASLIASLLNNNINLVQIFTDNLPIGLSNILVQFIDASATGGSFFLLLFAYLIMGSNGPRSIIIASDTLYGVNIPDSIRLKVKATVMTIIIILLLLFMIFIPLLGDIIIKFIISLFNNKEIFYKYSFIYSIIKYIISFIIIYANIKLIYTMAPDEKIKSNTTSIGSLFTTTGWIIFSEIFSLYITKFAKYDALYGNFASVLILLLWLYFLAYLFVVGMAINVNLYKNGKWYNEKNEC